MRNKTVETSPKLFQELMRIARDVSRGKHPDPLPLFELTKSGLYPPLISDLAESFGLMVIKVEAREFKLRQTIERLQQINRDLERAQSLLEAQNRSLKKNLRSHYAIHQIVGHSRAMGHVVDAIKRLSDTPLNVLIEGETGTGKELVAKALHYNSSRADFPFVALNCAALPETLLESELFGIEKGVATGVTQRIGRVEQAHRGTLFLDEIGDMPLASQAKLLRVIEQREVERIGGRQPLAIDIRVIAATNKNLDEEVQAKRFRADLYFRLNVVKILLPPLRERRDDIPLLANFFADECCRAMKQRRISFSEEALQALISYNWPGNIRELRNEIERCIALASSPVIEVHDLSETIRRSLSPPTSIDTAFPPSALPMNLEALEREAIQRAIAHAKGNKSLAAKLLGISREGLRRKLQRYGLIVGS